MKVKAIEKKLKFKQSVICGKKRKERVKNGA